MQVDEKISKWTKNFGDLDEWAIHGRKFASRTVHIQQQEIRVIEKIMNMKRRMMDTGKR